MRERSLHGVMLILAAAVLWGTSGTAQSFATPTLSALWIGTLRLAVAAVFFALWWLVERYAKNATAPAVPSARPLARLPWPAILGAALSMCVYNLAFFAGVRASSVAIGTALALGSAPVWAGLVQGVVGRRVPDGIWWLGVGIAVGGLALALGSGESDFPAGGVALCLLAGLSYAAYARFTKSFADGAGIVFVTGCVFALAALFAAPLAWLVAGVPHLTGADPVVLAWLGVAGTGVAYLLFALGIRHVTSATAVALGMAEPVAAVCFAVLIVGERPGGLAFLGLAIVLAGLAVLVRTELADAKARGRSFPSVIARGGRGSISD